MVYINGVYNYIYYINGVYNYISQMRGINKKTNMKCEVTLQIPSSLYPTSHYIKY